MSKRILLDYDAEFGIAQYIVPDEDGVTIQTVQNVDPLLERNAVMRSVHTQAPRGDQTFGNHVASIPLAVWERFRKENPELDLWTQDAQAWLIRKLNSPEYQQLKTFDGNA